MPNRFESVEEEFPSLKDCVDHVQNLINRGQYLFRGECSDKFLTTPSMLDRVLNDQTLPPKCRTVIADRVKRLHADLQEFFNLDSSLAMGFLQHYEVPTNLLDLTSDPTVAAYFAAGGDVGSSGLFATIPRDVGPAAEIQDLTRHPKANRPRRQSAFTFHSERYTNLKSDECIAELGVRWYRFTLLRTDKERFAANHNLLAAHTDEVAGVIQLLLDDYGKTNDWTAKWLADHVVAAPFITRIVGVEASGKTIVELVSVEDAGMEYDVIVERLNNYRIWSNAFSDTRGSGGFANLRPIIQ